MLEHFPWLPIVVQLLVFSLIKYRRLSHPAWHLISIPIYLITSYARNPALMMRMTDPLMYLFRLALNMLPFAYLSYVYSKNEGARVEKIKDYLRTRWPELIIVSLLLSPVIVEICMFTCSEGMLPAMLIGWYAAFSNLPGAIVSIATTLLFLAYWISVRALHSRKYRWLIVQYVLFLILLGRFWVLIATTFGYDVFSYGLNPVNWLA